MIGDHVFVNNATMGLYAKIVFGQPGFEIEGPDLP